MPFEEARSTTPSAGGPPPRLASPEVLLFDWHGTLVNTLDAMYRAIEDMLLRLDELDLVRRLTPEGSADTREDAKLVRYIRIFRRLPPRVLAERRVSRTDIFDAIFGDDAEAIAIAHAAYDARYRQHFGRVFPFQDGVRGYLTSLRASGVRVGVATNRRREFFDAELTMLEGATWTELFDVSVCGDEVERRKPAPDVVHEALERLGVRPSARVWFVGDSVADVTTAKAAGVTSVFYNGALWPTSSFARMFVGDMHTPDAIVDDFDGLVDLVESSVGSPELVTRVQTSRPVRLPPRQPPAPHVEPAWQPAVAHLAPPRIILFDWHATLVDTLDAMYRAVDDTLPELFDLGLMTRMVSPEESRSIDDKKLVEYVRSSHKLHPKIRADRKISRTDIFEVLFGADEDAKRVAHATFNKHYRKHYGDVRPFEPHVEEVLVGLRELDLRVGVITNRDREFFVEELAKVGGTGWQRHFDTSVCGDDTARRKPHPDQVILAARNLGAEPTPEVWYVGDSTTDTIAAKVAGITSVFFNGAQWDEAWLGSIFPGTERYPYRPDVVVNDFSELWALVLATLGAPT